MKKIKLFFTRLYRAIILVILANLIFMFAGIITVLALIASALSIPYYLFTGKGMVKMIENKLVQP